MKQLLRPKTGKKGKTLAAAFLIPVLIMFGVCVLRGIYPFGDECILHIDMYHQYAPFFMEFLDKLKSGGSLFYSWDLGLGSDFIATYAYYLASPMNWLLVFCPQRYLIEFMTLLIIIKTGLCGVSLSYYLLEHFKTESRSVILPSVFYALSGFVCAYYWDIMWMDCIWLVPLIILGLERIVKEKRAGLYCVTLALSIWSNYYISIMICIFLVFYFLILLLETVGMREKRESVVRFAVYSILSAGTSAMILFPEIKILGYSGSGKMNFPDTLEWYFGGLSELARHCVNVQTTTTEGDWPNIYCGVAVFFLFVLYVLNKKISWKEKIPRIAFLAFFLVSFSCNILDYVWHGFHFPDGLPARQSFLYAFLLLVVCYEAVLKREGNTVKHLLISGVVTGVLLTAFAFLTDTSLVSTWSMIVTALLILCYLFLMYIERSSELSMKKTAWVLAFAVVISEAAMNLNDTGIDVTSRSVYTENLEDYRALVAETKVTDDSFFRIEKFQRMMKNESCLYGSASASLFSSLMNINVADAYKSVGMEGGKNFYCFNGATPMISAMLGVKYMITDSGEENSPLRTQIAQSGNSYLYENQYCLPLGFMTGTGLEDQWDRENLSEIQAVNRLGRLLGASDDTLTTFDGAEVMAGDTVITVDEDCYVYASYSNSTVSSITEEVNGRTRGFTKCTHGYLLDLGWCEAGTEIHLHSPQTQTLQVIPYKLSVDSVDTVYDTLMEQTMTLDRYSDTHIAGHINVEKAGNLILSVPKEDGWSVYVDGKETETGSFMGAFYSIALDTGNHTIEMKYQTPGFLTGALVSGICLAALVALFLIKKRKSVKE